MRKILVIILGILLIISGIGLIVSPISAFGILGCFMGVSLLVNGFANIYIWFQVRKRHKVSIWHLISGILSIVFALVIFGDIKLKIAVEIVLLYIVAVWFFIIGIMRIIMSLKLRKMYKEENEKLGKNWWIVLILGILLIICGIMSFANPLILVLAIGLNLGINMMFCGIDLLTLATVME